MLKWSCSFYGPVGQVAGTFVRKNCMMRDDSQAVKNIWLASASMGTVTISYSGSAFSTKQTLDQVPDEEYFQDPYMLYSLFAQNKNTYID